MRTPLLIASLLLPAPVLAAPGAIAFVNGTGAPLTDLQLRAVGKSWTPLSPGLSPGARVVSDLRGEDCAYDVRANLAGGAGATWNRLNLCEVKSVTLNRRADGTSWADYD